MERKKLRSNFSESPKQLCCEGIREHREKKLCDLCVLCVKFFYGEKHGCKD